jgi:fibronectin type 3 domain-containing protein
VYPHGNFCTIGIEDHTETIGLEYTFNNSYPTAAATLSDESALFISTRPLIPDYPYVAIEQVYIYDDNMNNHLEPGESAELSIRLGNRGLVDAIGVSAILSSTDNYVTINTANASYGDIPAQDNAYPFSNYALSVAANCPADHSIIFTLNITGNEGNWDYNFPLNVYVPEIGFSEMAVNDVTGDQNGILDPGETANITIHLDNIGDIPSPAGTATLTCSTPGITINSGTDTFPEIDPGNYELLSFNISASSAMTDGTLVQLNFNATANGTTASATEYLEVGAPLEVIIGNGTETQTYPLDRYYNYCAHESIYLASEVGMPGVIKSIAYYKAGGSDVNGITPVAIYMKNTAASSLSGGNYSTAGYTQVFSGTFPNNATSGWMEVDLDPMFVYDGTSNLGILIVKGNQQWISNYPTWTYTSTGATRARQNRSDYNAPTDLVASNHLPNLRLKMFPDITMNLPPQDFTATGSHHSVHLSWSEPTTGAPDTYNIYRDSTLLTSVETLSHTDLDVTNGTEYSYYLTAVYTEGESDPTPTVTVTPDIHSPTNLVAIPGNTVVDLSWNPAEGRNMFESFGTKNRSISGYKIFRDGSGITTVPGTSYQDTGLTNGVSYSYQVTTVYADPAGESEPSNTVVATPNIVEFVILGTGSSVTLGYQNSPINICNNSVHGQSVYTAAELNAAGITGPILITGLGFNVNSAPDYSLPDFIVRIKHTDAADAADWHTAEDLVTVYSNASYLPLAGGYDMLHFTTPFEWNGTDNILVDSAFGLLPNSTDSGTVQYTSMTNGYRFAWSDTADQTNVFSGGIAVSRRPNLRLEIQPVQIVLDAPVVDITHDAQNTILSWNAVSNADEYHIYSSSESDGAYTQIGTSTGLSFTDERGLDKAFYYVKAVAN